MKFVYVKEKHNDDEGYHIFRVYEDNSYSMWYGNRWEFCGKGFRWVKDGYIACYQKILTEKEAFIEML